MARFGGRIPLATQRKLAKEQCKRQQQSRRFPTLSELCIRLISRHLDSHRLQLDGKELPIQSKVALFNALKRSHNLKKKHMEIVLDKSMQHFDFSDYSRLSDEELRTVVQCCPNIRSLNLKRCSLLTDAAFMSVSKPVPAAPSAVRLTPISRGLEHGAHSAKVQAKELAPLRSLQHLSVANLSQISAKALAHFTRECHNIQVLDLSWCSSLDDEAVIEIVEGSFSTLTELHLWQCRLIEGDCVEEMAAQCSSLEVLNLRGCDRITDSAVAAVADFCAKISSLVLEGCCRITDFSIAKLATQCSRLTELNVSWCEKLTDKSAAALHKPIAKLLCAGCSSLTDKGLKALSRQCYTTLTTIDLSFCGRITTAGVQKYLLDSCPKIHSITVECCPKVSIKALRVEPPSRTIEIHATKVKLSAII